MRKKDNELDRRDFMKRSAGATVAATASAALLCKDTVHGAAPKDEKTAIADTLPTRVFGKTGLELPILGHLGFQSSGPFRGAGVLRTPIAHLLTQLKELTVRHFHAGIMHIRSACVQHESSTG